MARKKAIDSQALPANMRFPLLARSGEEYLSLQRKGFTMTTSSYNLAVIGGDGTGPEVAAEALKVIIRDLWAFRT